VPSVYLQSALAHVARSAHADGLEPVTPPVLEVAAMPRDQIRLRCASVLKPLLFWVAANSAVFAGDRQRWRRLAEPAVTVSDNAATIELWDACGGDWLLAGIADATGVRWPLERGGRRSFGRVLVRADELALAYAAMARASGSGDEAAGLLLAWMRQVPDQQGFGVRQAAADALRVPAGSVGVKAGWFCDSDEQALRTHAVAVIARPEHGDVLVTAVVTAVEPDQADRARYEQLYNEGAEVLPLHQRYAGSAICSATAALLDARRPISR
jgi:hypothetical protein